MKRWKKQLGCMGIAMAMAVSSVPSAYQSMGNTLQVQAAVGFQIDVNGVAVRYTGSDSTVIIPEGVTEIGEGFINGYMYLYPNSPNVRKLVISEGVTVIDSRACPALRQMTELYLPSTLESIGIAAFADADALKEVVIPDSVISMGMTAFSNCDRLEKVTLSQNLEAIGDYTFRDCSIKDITIPSKVTSIGDEAFYSNPLQKLTIPGNVKYIGRHAFAECDRLKTVTLQYGVEQIDTGAFEYCKSLEQVILPDQLKEIGDDAFRGCKFTSIYIPASVTYISECAFNEGITLQGEAGSYVEQYCWNNGHNFEAVTPPQQATVVGWNQDSVGYWYQNADGSYPKADWANIAGVWYYFDLNGYMATGWVSDKGIWYYMDALGAMETGWYVVGNKWYYSNPDGSMVSNMWIGDYYLGNDGAMLTNTITPDGHLVDVNGLKVQ